MRGLTVGGQCEHHLPSNPAYSDHVTGSRAYNISHFPQKFDLCIDDVRLAIAEHFRAVTALQNETICRSGQGGDEGGEVAGFRAGDQGGEEGYFGESGGYCV